MPEVVSFQQGLKKICCAQLMFLCASRQRVVPTSDTIAILVGPSEPFQSPSDCLRVETVKRGPRQKSCILTFTRSCQAEFVVVLASTWRPSRKIHDVESLCPVIVPRILMPLFPVHVLLHSLCSTPECSGSAFYHQPIVAQFLPHSSQKVRGCEDVWAGHMCPKVLATRHLRLQLGSRASLQLFVWTARLLFASIAYIRRLPRVTSTCNLAPGRT